MAENRTTPLLERLRYLCIVGSNLDEFFEIRISSLKEQQRRATVVVGGDAMTPDRAFEQVQLAAPKLVDRHNSLLMNDVLPELLSLGVGLLASPAWPENDRTSVATGKRVSDRV